MSQKGIMAEIRALLAQDKSPKEVITLGYKPSTVYRAQQQLEEGLPQPNQLPFQGPTQVVVNNNMEPQGTTELAELKEENTLLNQQLEAQVMELESVREELHQVKALNEELKVETSQAKVLRARLAVLEPEARAAGEARKESLVLTALLNSTKADRRQKEQEWQEKFLQEQRARQQVQALVDQSNAEIGRLKETNQQLQSQNVQLSDTAYREAWKMYEPYLKELAELRQLKVWAGHPCVRCHQPISGIPSRVVAGKILREGGYGHGECPKKKGR